MVLPVAGFVTVKRKLGVALSKVKFPAWSKCVVIFIRPSM
jgi:hypothetical protein